MNGTFRHERRSRVCGLSLIEMAVSMAVAAILIIGAYVTSVIPMAEVSKETLQDEALTSDVNAAFTEIGTRVRSGMSIGARLFVIYSTNSGGAVADGTAGVKLSVPYSSASNDVNIYAQNGALIVTQNGKTSNVLASGVTSVSFTAVMSGSPLARTGAVLCSLSVVSQSRTYTFSTSILPRNQ